MPFDVIAIEREYASGGREIGEKLAKRLCVPYYAEIITQMAADKLSWPVDTVRRLEESLTGSLLYALNMYANMLSGRAADGSDELKLAITEAGIIRDLALSPCVIIGRGASGLLHEKKRLLKVFIHADIETRKRRAVEIYGVTPQKVESVLKQSDKRRANYFRATTGFEWKDERIYDLVLDSGKLGTKAVVDMLYNFIKNR